ncbi:MAG: YbaB/EbfC family nucleoid-associated protein [Candidatus Ratteibacteria bacterium]|nr:YbaB/EbfC family nucleoid-associated protein [Candidatus Ratteibacteria bacterium]
MGNIFDNLKQIGQLRQQAAQFERVLRSKTVEVSSPKGELKLVINGKMEIISIDISPDVLKPENKGYIEKLFKNTFASAQKEIEKIMSTEMKSTLGL